MYWPSGSNFATSCCQINGVFVIRCVTSFRAFCFWIGLHFEQRVFKASGKTPESTKKEKFNRKSNYTNCLYVWNNSLDSMSSSQGNLENLEMSGNLFGLEKSGNFDNLLEFGRHRTDLSVPSEQLSPPNNDIRDPSRK